MYGLGFIAAIIIGGLAGWAASAFMGARTGIVAYVLLGVVGAALANFLLGLVGIFASPTLLSQGIVGFIGACILIWGARALRGR